MNILKKHSFTILLGALLSLLLFSRAIPFILHGPFGFGYDTGIYKHIFDNITSLSQVLTSEIYPLPAFLAYITNTLNLPIDILIYYSYILFGVAIAIPLYILTKNHFGKTAGLIAVAIFTVSHVQSLASQIYLFKAEFGAIFMLFAFHYYARRSWKFYSFTFLLALTQLPQLLILAIAVGISTLINIKKEFKYHATLIGVAVGAFLFLLIFTPQHIINGFAFVRDAMFGEARVDSLQVGYLMTISEFLKKEIIIILLAVTGLAILVKNSLKKLLKKSSDGIEDGFATALLPLYIAILFLSIIVFGKLFFERRYIMELDLFLIPFAAYALVAGYNWVIKELEYENEVRSINTADSSKKVNLATTFKVACVAILCAITVGSTCYYYFTVTPSLTVEEQSALKFIGRKTDVSYAMVTNGMIAPWVYGFSGKETLAPGIFTSVMDYDQFTKYHATTESAEKLAMLTDIAGKYGDFYLLVGAGQTKEQNLLNQEKSGIDRSFHKGNVTVYKLSASK